MATSSPWQFSTVLMTNRKQKASSKKIKLSVALLNIDGLKYKICDIQHIIARDKLHVVALCETKLDPSVKDNVYIPGFRMWRRDRTNNGGGVALYVQDHIETKLRSDLMNPEVEIIWVEMKLPEGRPVLLGCCYRPSDNNTGYLLQIHKMMTRVSGENKDVFLMGDFNINWFSDSEKKKTADVISRLGWTQIVEVATRVTIDSEKCIDHIYTNISEHSEPKSIPTGCSDHNLITVKINRNVPQSKGRFRSNQFDREEFEINLFEKRLIESKSEKTLDTFTEIFLSVADEHAPLVNQNIYDSLRLDDELEALIIDRDEAKKEVIEKIHPFIEKKKAVQSWINEEQEQRISTQQQNVAKLIFKLINTWHADFDSDSDLESDSEGSSVQPRKKMRRDEFSFRKTDPETVKRWLVYLCDRVICEIDKTEAELLKLAAHQISGLICHILNRCIESGKIPKELKKKIKLFPFSANNYNQIRQSSGADRLHIILSYIFDVILYEQAKQFFIGDEKTSIVRLQRKLRQPETDRLSPGEANRAEAVLLDFTSSFDTISYKYLITNLGTSDFSDLALELIKSFLSIHKGSSGLPGGSCLAQLLRIIIISDLKGTLQPSAVMCNSYMMIYADGDPQTIERKLDNKIETVNHWNKQFNISFEIRRKEFKPSDRSAMFKILESMLRCHGDESNWIRAPGNIVKQNGDWEYDNVSKELELNFGPEYEVEPQNVNNSRSWKHEYSAGDTN